MSYSYDNYERLQENCFQKFGMQSFIFDSNQNNLEKERGQQQATRRLFWRANFLPQQCQTTAKIFDKLSNKTEEHCHYLVLIIAYTI